MGDYPAQKFRYGFVVKTSEIELAEEKFDELDDWFRETFPDFTGFGFDDGLVYFSGWASSGEKVLVGVPILTDAAVSTDKNLSAYLGGYVAGEFDVDAFVRTVDKAVEMYEENPEIGEKIREVLGDAVSGSPSVVTASGTV